MQRGANSIDLRQHVHAVSVFIHQTNQPSHLTLDQPEPVMTAPFVTLTRRDFASGVPLVLSVGRPQARQRVVVASKIDTEGVLFGQLIAQTLRARAGGPAQRAADEKYRQYENFAVRDDSRLNPNATAVPGNKERATCSPEPADVNAGCPFVHTPTCP